MKVFEATEACKICEGYCCRHMGCHFSPSDIKDITFESLKNEIDKGYISIDWWEGDSEKGEIEEQYYLRMRHVGAPVVDPSYGGRCIMLTDKGCKFSFEERPLGARALRPSNDFRCHSYYTKEQCKNDWLEYIDVLRELVEFYRNR